MAYASRLELRRARHAPIASFGETDENRAGFLHGRSARGGLLLEHPLGDRAVQVLPNGDKERSCSLLGVRLNRVTAAQAVQRCDSFIKDGLVHQVVTVNLDFLRIAQHDAEFRTTLNSADLAVADGMPLVWASRLRRKALPQRVAGVDLVDSLCRLAAEHEYSVYLLGAGPGVAAKAAATLRNRYPGLRFAGIHAPPMRALSDDEERALVERVREARPHILFVAFGAPRQEFWLRHHLQALCVPLCVGVGGSFDIISGSRRRAPRWMQRLGLEWSFRLLQEPRRLWRRYLLGDLPTCWRLIASPAQD